jgi:protein O-GlcNAc transferase
MVTGMFKVHARRLHLVAVVLALVAGCPRSNPTSRADSSGDENLAFEEERAAADALPATPEVLAAEAMLADGRPREARIALEALVEATPSDLRAWLDLALAFEMLEDLDSAERAYRAAIVNGAGETAQSAEILNNLGALLRDTDRLDEGISLIRQAIELRPAFASAHLNLGLALEDAGDDVGAMAEYRRVIAIADHEPTSRINLGLILLRQGQAETALIELRRALPLAEERADLAAVGSGLRQAGDPAMAIRALNAAIEASEEPAPPALTAELALAQFAANHREEAEAMLRALLTSAPTFHSAHYLLANMLAAREAWADAAREYEAFLRAEPSAPEASEARRRLEYVRTR